MTRTLQDSLRWVEEGTALIARALRQAGDDETLGQDSALPGWTRKHVLAHVAANADAIGNLVHWAQTGEETPMYSSSEQRNADIEAGATKSAHDLVAWFEASAARLAEGFAGLDDQAWERDVRTAQGRTVPASETPWMRSREVMVHAVDLDAGITFDQLPADFLVALGSDIVGKRSAGGGPALHVSAVDADASWEVAGDGEPTKVTGPLAQVVAWLAGRSSHDVVTAEGDPAPTLPAWL